MTTEIHVNSNIGPQTSVINDIEIHKDSNDDSRDYGKDGESVSDSYVHLVPEMNDTAAHPPIPFHMSQSQVNLISSIEKATKIHPVQIPLENIQEIKKEDEPKWKSFVSSGKSCSQNPDARNLWFSNVLNNTFTNRHAIEDHRSSTASSSYASCRPHGRDVSCHTYVDIEDVVDLRDNRDMELERCNSISTVSTLPMITLQPPEEDVIIRSGRNLDGIQKNPQTEMTPRIHYEMKAPSKTKLMKKYMILFSVVLFIVVLSIGIAYYVGTTKVVKDIPDKVGAEFQKQPAVQSTHRTIELTLESVKKSLNDITGGQDELKKSLSNVNTELKGIIKECREYLTNVLVSDMLMWKSEIVGNLYTVIHSTVCIRNCTGRPNGDYQSCFTCDGYISCTNNITVNRSCADSQYDRPLYWDNNKGRCEYNSSTCVSNFI